MSYRIFANHAHVFQETVRPHATVVRLLQLMDNCGIEQAVCYAPFSGQMDTEETSCNGWLAKEIEQQDRLFGFGTLDFNKSNLKEQVRQIYELGFKGIKLHPAYQKFNILSPEAFEAYQAAEEHKLFLSFHTGIHWHRIKDYDVVLFDEIAHHFPKLGYSLEHVGGYSFFPEALAVIVNNSRVGNVYGGLTSVFTKHISRFWHLTDERLIELVAQGGAKQLIFGLDFPYNLEKETNIGLERLKNLNLSDEELELILGGNLRRVLGIE
ncbi:amidohydrolase family protein [Paenibacillus sp. IITD108]|uniref:amidohydrolase family protein n=1 Tax=Paenibacillus sp. IITD108 TaxID=3116649 RepID=UPI002F3E8CEB